MRPPQLLFGDIQHADHCTYKRASFAQSCPLFFLSGCWSSAKNINPSGSTVSVRRRWDPKDDATTFTFNVSRLAGIWLAAGRAGGRVDLPQR